MIKTPCPPPNAAMISREREAERRAMRYDLTKAILVAQVQGGYYDETGRQAVVLADNVLAMLDRTPDAVAELLDGEPEYRG